MTGHLLHFPHLVVRMLSWGAPRATLLVLTGGDEALVRGVGADRGMRMGHRARLVVWSPARMPDTLDDPRGQARIGE
jgi:hypothetical protein